MYTFAVNDGCLEFREGLCGWVNSNQEVSPWRQVMKKEMERSTNQVNSYLRKKGWKRLQGQKQTNKKTKRHSSHFFVLIIIYNNTHSIIPHQHYGLNNGLKREKNNNNKKEKLKLCNHKYLPLPL